MPEHVAFHGVLKSKEQGDPTSAFDLDFAEGWPVFSRHNWKLAASTAKTTVTTGDIGTVKVLGIKANKEVSVRLGTAGSDAFTCRGILVLQGSATTVILQNSSSYTGGNEVVVFAAGLE